MIMKTTERAQHGNRININLAENEIMRVKWALMANGAFRPFQSISPRDDDDSLNECI